MEACGRMEGVRESVGYLDGLIINKIQNQLHAVQSVNKDHSSETRKVVFIVKWYLYTCMYTGTIRTYVLVRNHFQGKQERHMVFHTRN